MLQTARTPGRGPADPSAGPLRPEPPPLLYFPSLRVSPEARRGRHLRSSPHTPSRESGAAAGGLRVSELTALRARGRGRVGPGKTGAWAACGCLENAKGEKTATGRPEGHAGAGSVRDAPGLTSLRPSHVSLWGWSPSPRATKTDAHSNTTSDQTRRPAEFKHITKRRKRN